MHGLHHVGYWVADLGAATRRWQEDLGAGPFEVLPHIAFDSFEFEGRRGAAFDHSAAFAAWGPVVVELDQVHAIDDRLAAAYGYVPGAVSHVAWLVPDLGRESARLERLGCRLISVAQAGPVRAAWHDGGPLFPHPIEVHQASAPVATMHDRLSAAAARVPHAPGLAPASR
jgi:catechol 2,3-dioxygenase-like lactoylglutathione lyase family enzyme